MLYNKGHGQDMAKTMWKSLKKKTGIVPFKVSQDLLQGLSQLCVITLCLKSNILKLKTSLKEPKKTQAKSMKRGLKGTIHWLRNDGETEAYHSCYQHTSRVHP